MIEPGSTRWNELVEGCRRKTAEALWAIGDAALEIAPLGDNGTHNGRYALVARFAQEIERNFQTVRDLRSIASCWPPAERLSGTPVSAHGCLRFKKELLQPGMTRAQARVAAGISMASYGSDLGRSRELGILSVLIPLAARRKLSKWDMKRFCESYSEIEWNQGHASRVQYLHPHQGD